MPRNSTAVNYLGANDEAIKLSLFPILMRAFQNWLNELHSIASSCFHVVSFLNKSIRNFPIYKQSISLFHSLLSFVFICCTTRCHSLSLVVSLVVICCHSLSLVVPLAVIRCITRCISLSYHSSVFL